VINNRFIIYFNKIKGGDMRAATFMFVCSIFCVIFLSVITQAQNSLTHNTGTLEVTMIDNGYIGDNCTDTWGGVVFNGNQNALCTAGIIYGQYGQGAGMYYTWYEDFYNVIPIAGFFPIQHFNQYAYYTVALVGTPDSRTKLESFSNSGQDFVFLRGNVSNNTTTIDDFYPGIFADWDVNDVNNNRGGYDPSRNLFYMYDKGGGTDPSYYGIMGIAVNGVPMAPNTMMGAITDSIAWDRWALYDLMTSTAFDTITINGDYRMYTCAGPFSFPAGSTLVVDMAIVAGTSLTDLIDNANAAILYGVNIPVELISFTATSLSGKVLLNWTTATELNNLGFEVERKIINNNKEGEWVRIAFTEGYGTTTEPKEYSYVDDISGITASSLAYRLKQIDFNGSYEYSDEVYVENPAPVDYALHQNYPNPFNPTTIITYSVPYKSNVELKVYNSLGAEVELLANEPKESGTHKVEFDATVLPSGIYFYRLYAGEFFETKKMVLIR
jgi:hypothetical protein